jgi:hypothetical protein
MCLGIPELFFLPQLRLLAGRRMSGMGAARPTFLGSIFELKIESVYIGLAVSHANPVANA